VVTKRSITGDTEFREGCALPPDDFVDERGDLGDASGRVSA
jgi:hypothetical protein